MGNRLLTELTALLQDTVALLNCSEPDTETWEHYSRRRQQIFASLQVLFAVEQKTASTALRDLLQSVSENDRLLMQKLAIHRARCYQDLSAMAKARQAFREETVAPSVCLLNRCA